MRIIAGNFARRVLIAPEGYATRPTADRAREALFNILQHQDWGREAVSGAKVLDVCCGTGALGLEALSRGAESLVLIEQDTAAFQIAKQNVTALGVQSLCQLLRVDARQPPSATVACDLIFLDPPYGKNLPAMIVPALLAAGWIAAGALLVIETARGEPLSLPPQFCPKIERIYGAACIRIFDYFPDESIAPVT
jgi:16S rRNA (guanine966-N2)-methyltransferase